MQQEQPSFAVVGGPEVHSSLAGAEPRIVDVVEATYLAHRAGATTNPPSSFLTFPSRPADRIIALPASIHGDRAVDGIKWIASVPGNVDRGLPRASAVTILNDPSTGLPYACVESSLVSAARTAASAALAAKHLVRGRAPRRVLGVIGAGPIAETILRYLAAVGERFEQLLVHDLRAERAQELSDSAAASGLASTARTTGLEETIRASDLIVFATTAPAPYLDDPGLLSHQPLVLHVSLRDLGVPIILDAVNVVDDVEHVLKASTSLHLAQQQRGGAQFIAGTIADVIAGALTPDPGRTTVFSPFGLGVLDLAVARFIVDDLRDRGALQTIDDFFGHLVLPEPVRR